VENAVWQGTIGHHEAVPAIVLIPDYLAKYGLSQLRIEDLVQPVDQNQPRNTREGLRAEYLS
jgi:hypothetical protein